MKENSANLLKKLLSDARRKVAGGSGKKLVALALAASTKLDAASAAKTMALPFSSPKIGLKDKAAMRVFKKHLGSLLPESAAAAIGRIPEEPGLHPADIAEYVDRISRPEAAPEPLRAAPAVAVKSAAAEARKKCADNYGKDFAGKASDRLIQALDIRMLSSPRESLMEQAMVLEFESAEGGAAPAPPRAARETLELAVGMRSQRVAGVRQAFYSEISPIRAEFERRLGGAARGLRESAQDLGSATDVCWLNGTLRMVAPPRRIADMAGDPKLTRIGIPRALAKELDVTGATVHAVRFRASQGLTGKNVVVAVIDGEVDSTHPALRGRVMQKKNYTKEAWGAPDPHATGVAGIIASADQAIMGMAPEAMIANYKVFSTGPDAHGTEFDATLAIQQALEDGVAIANCSWGVGLATDGSSREARAFNRAWDLGLIIVKSAGNRGPAAGSLTSPADARGVIVVAATDRRGGGVESYSSRGPIAAKPGPDLAAPGGSPNDGVHSLTPGGGTGGIGAGTSFASPHVAGMIALLLERDPILGPDAVKTLLAGKGTPLAGASAADGGAGLAVL